MLETLSKLGQKFSSFLGEPKESSPELQDYFSGDPISKVLPWEAYDEDYGVFIGKSSLGFTIEAIPLVGSSHVLQKEVSSIFQEIIEEGESIQCFLWADHRISPFLDRWKHARNQSKEIYREISQKRTEFFQNTKQITPRLFRFIFSYSVQGKCDHITLEKLKEKRQKILKTLKGFTYAFSWNIDDFLETLGALINFTSDCGVQKRHWNPYQTLSSQLPTGGTLSVEDSHLKWTTDTSTFLKTYRAVDYPSYWSLSEMQRLIGDIFRDAFRIEVPFYLHYGVHCPKQSKEESKFKKRSLLIDKQGRSSLLLRFIPSLQSELAEADAVRKELSQAEKFVWTQFSAGIWADEKNISGAEQSLKSLFRINHFTLAENRYLHLPSYLSALPMTWAEYIKDLKGLNLLRTTITSECGALVPLQGEWMGTKTAGMLLLGRRGQLANWNPFDNKSGNYNTIVVGRSGAGKSVFMQDMILSGLGTGAKVFILDVGRSFEKLCDMLDGQFIEFSNAKQICLNPFTNVSKDDEKERDNTFSFLKPIISYMAAPKDGTSDYEDALVELSIRHAWNEKGNEATITDVAQWLQNHEDQRAKSLGLMLSPYTKIGIHARFFEGKNNVDFNNSMVVIELEELKGKSDLQSVVLQLFIMNITNKIFMGDRKTPFYICIDEAWDLLRGKQSEEFIETLARRLRKYNGSLVVGTQNLEDFFAKPGAMAAFQNSDWMSFLSQKKSSISRFAESGKIDMDDAKKHALESVATIHGEYSEVMICDADGNYSIQRLILDPFSQLLYTTKPQEYVQVKELQEKGMSISQAINHIISNEKK